MNNKIKILFVSQYVVNDSIFLAGHRSFSYYLSAFCNDEAFEVGYVVDHKNEEGYYKMKNQFLKARDFSISTPIYIRALKFIFYFSFIRLFLSIINPTWIYLDPFRSYLYKKAVIKINNKNWIPDVIVFEWTEMIFLRNFCKKSFSKAILVGMEHDVSFHKLFRQFKKVFFYDFFLLERFKRRELNALNGLDIVLVLSNDDLLLLKKNHIDEKRILLISPFYNKTNQRQKSIKSQIIFFGAMNRLENLDAVKWFLENVFIPFKLYKLMSFFVVGSGTPQQFIEKYKKIENLVFTGFVEHPEEYFKSALCMVVPLTYGGGIKIKVLEAMSSSVTILSNDIGIEGIKATHKVSYIHCLEPVDYYNGIVELHNNHALAHSIGEAGRLMMESNYNYEESFKDYKNRIISLLKYANK